MRPLLSQLALVVPALATSSTANHAPPPASSAVGDRPPNVLLIVLDDLGYEKLRPFNVGLPTTNLPETDTLQALRDQGILYSRMYANPVCSPTRACMLTGRYGATTGMLTYVNPDSAANAFTLLSTEVLLPARLSTLDYRSGAFGKWHLSTDDATAANNCHPIASGFERFRGHIGNNDLVSNPTHCPPCNGHFAWRLLEADAGTPCTASNYTTLANLGTTWDARYTREKAVEWINSVVSADPDRPWFAYVAFNPPHESLQIPPLEVVSGVVVNVKPTTLTALTQARIGTSIVDMLAPGSIYLPPQSQNVLPLVACPTGPKPIPADDAGRLVYRANVEALDWEIGQLLASIDAEALEKTTVIVISDNGTPEGVMDVHRGAPNGDGLAVPYAAGPPYPPFHGKRSLYEQGVRVPMIVAGASVSVGGPSAVYDQTVGALDLWATIVDIAGGAVPTSSDPQRESKSFKASFSNLSAVSLRRSAYCEIANSNGRAYTGTGLCTDVAAGCPTVVPATSPWSDLENSGAATCPPITYQRALISGRFKYVRHVVDPHPSSTCAMPAYCSAAGPNNHQVEELFDVIDDPNELNNLICSPPPTCNLAAMRTEVCRLSGP